MQLQRILALAAVASMGCAVSNTRAYSFGDADAPLAYTSSDNSTENEESRIYGGTEADAQKHPYTVSLRKSAEGSTYCGGALVASQYIVTAAHCVKDTTFASLGSKYSSGSKEGERIRVTDVWVHPKYTKDTHVFDVAVMKLEKPSSYKPLGLCKADGSQNKENTMAVVRGWGITETKVAASTLLEVNVKIITNAICNKSYNNRITPEMICAGEGGGKDTCQGDSGGALISNDVLVGVVSWGGACGEAPGVYVRVANVLDFINEKIGGGGASPSPSATTPTPAATTATPAATTATPTTTPSLTPSTGNATTAPPASSDGDPSQFTPKATTAAPKTTTAPPATSVPSPVPTSDGGSSGKGKDNGGNSTPAPAATTVIPSATTATPSTTTATPMTTVPSPVPSTDGGSSGKGKDKGGSSTPAPATTTATPMTTVPSPAPTSDGGSSGKGKDKGSDSAATKKPKKDCGVRL